MTRSDEPDRLRLAAALAHAHQADTIALDAGEQLVLSPMATPEMRRVNIDRTSAWEAGQLVFEDEPPGAARPRPRAGNPLGLMRSKFPNRG